MSELRAPDPTLNAVGDLVVIVFSDLGVAHLYPEFRHPAGHLEVEGNHFGTSVMWSNEAAYVAVPCRDCFPDAPPPGHQVIGDGGSHSHGPWMTKPDELAWQVAADA